MNYKILFIILIVTSNALFGQRNTVYENFTAINYLIPENDLRYLQNGKILNESIYFSFNKIRTIKIKEADTVPKFIANILHGSLANEGTHTVPQNQIDSLRKSTLCYMGIVSINSEYESYIFMKDFSSYGKISKEFYVLNVQNKRVLSIYNICSYSGDCNTSFHYYTLVQFPNLLTRKYKMEVHDVIIAHKPTARKVKKENKKHNENMTRNYQLNSQGYIDEIK